jgi:hypothetical protein
VDSSAAGAEPSLAAAVLGSSPSQDKSVDFLHGTILVVKKVRLPSYKYYSGKNFHLQARPDDSHGRRAKDAGDIYKPGFSGRLLFSLSYCRLFSTSRRAWLRLVLRGRRLRLDNTSRPLCHPRHEFFIGGGWTAASLGRPAHCVPVLSFPLVNRVRRGDLLRQVRSQSSAYKILQIKYSTTLLEEFTSWDVVSITFIFLATRLRATLRSHLGSAGRLASRLVEGLR